MSFDFEKAKCSRGNMKICIIGTGYVGLVSGACFAESGNTVYCIDKDAQKIASLKEGYIPIFEPGLEEMVKKNRHSGHLVFSTDLSFGINQADVCFIAVGTPQDEDGSADLSHVFSVCEEICKVAQKKIIIATKSTVPVGTGDKIEKLFSEKLKVPFIVFSNPEFLKEGDAINDFMKPDRVIVGTNDSSIIPMLTELYAPFNHQKNRLVFMSRKSAEITKYAANSMLALRISFMNEMANFCEKVGGNVHDVRLGIGLDARIGSSFLYPGLGFGGSCFPKDVQALLKMSSDVGMEFKTIKALWEVNENQPKLFFQKIKKSFNNNLKNKTLAVWGAAFKAKTDDVRCSQPLKIVDFCLAEEMKIKIYDPEALGQVKRIYGDKLVYCQSAMDCLKEADALFLGTEWNAFKSPDFLEIKKLLKTPKIFDGRNLYNSQKLKDLGFEYVGVGVS